MSLLPVRPMMPLLITYMQIFNPLKSHPMRVYIFNIGHKNEMIISSSYSDALIQIQKISNKYFLVYVI